MVDKEKREIGCRTPYGVIPLMQRHRYELGSSASSAFVQISCWPILRLKGSLFHLLSCLSFFLFFFGLNSFPLLLALIRTGHFKKKKNKRTTHIIPWFWWLPSSLSSSFSLMYLKVESVSAVEITSRSSSSSLSLGPRKGVKIPVPLRQGGGAAAAAAAAATADGAACTPDEIFCYTQSNSNRSHHQYHLYPAVSAAAQPTTATLTRGFCHNVRSAHYDSANMGIHHVDVSF